MYVCKYVRKKFRGNINGRMLVTVEVGLYYSLHFVCYFKIFIIKNINTLNQFLKLARDFHY